MSVKPGDSEAFAAMERTEFWKSYNEKRDQDYNALLYANEEIALDCVTMLVKKGLLDRALMFRDEQIGFAGAVAIIADIIAESLSDVRYQKDIAYFIEGEPTPEPDADR